MLDRISQYLVVMGLPGLLAISFLDSAAMPLSGGPDAVVLLLAWQKPALALFIAMAGAVGSTLGCLVLYGIGKKSGEKALSRFSTSSRERVRRKMERNGIYAIIAAVLAPPPFPTKLVVLAAGVFRTGKIKFAAAVLAGRFLRYAAVALLGAQFGGQTSKVLVDNLPMISLILILGILLVSLARALRNAGRPASAELPPAAEN